MKHTLLAAVLTLGSLTSGSAFAQAPGQTQDQTAPQHMHRTHNPHKEAMRMSKQLGLDPDQTAKVEPILAQRSDQRAAIEQNTALTPDQRMSQMRDLNRNTHQQLAGVLTPDQMQQLKAMRKQHHMREQQAAPAPNGL